MPIGQYQAPDIYIEEVSTGARPIQAVGTSTAAFIGKAPNGRARQGEAIAIPNWATFTREYVREDDSSTPLSHAVRGFFGNGGSLCYVVNVGNGALEDGLNVVATLDDVAIVAAPGYIEAGDYDAILEHCETMKDRVAILDAPEKVEDLTRLTDVATSGGGGGDGDGGGGSSGLRPRQSDKGFGAFYYPWITVRDAFDLERTVNVPPSGHIAGIWARTDATRGVHKAPANEIVRGALNVSHRLTRAEHAILNPEGVNVIRLYANEGVRVMGARTVAAAANEFRYLNVRRLFSMVEESIAESMRWVIFEPNNFPLWKSIQRDVTAFLIRLWRDGALQGESPEQAFFVKCDEETNPQEDIDAGIVTTIIGMAPVKPAEFVVFRISQMAGGADVETMES
jgi:hypothetical protein